MILHVIYMHKVHAPSVACEKRFLRRKKPIYLRQKVQRYKLLSKQGIFLYDIHEMRINSQIVLVSHIGIIVELLVLRGIDVYGHF